MLTAKVFKRLLNGGGEKAGSAGLAAEVDRLRREREVLAAELAGFPAQRIAAIESDDFSERKRTLAEREEKIYDEIERIDYQIGALSTRLLEVSGQERELLWRELRRQNDEAAAAFLTSARATLDAMRVLMVLREKAVAAGFERQVNAAFPFVPSLGEGCVISAETLAIFQNTLDRGHGANVTTLMPSAAPRPSAPAAVGAGDGAGVDVARDRPALNGAGRPAAPPPLMAPADVPREPKTFGEPGEGMRKVRVFRSGYSAPTGEQCTRGDFVWLPEAVAELAAERGAVDPVEDAR